MPEATRAPGAFGGTVDARYFNELRRDRIVGSSWHPPCSNATACLVLHSLPRRAVGRSNDIPIALVLLSIFLIFLLPASPIAAQTTSPQADNPLDQSATPSPDAGAAQVVDGDVLVEARRAFELRRRHVEGRRAAAIDGRGAMSARKDVGLRPDQRLGVGRLQRRVRSPASPSNRRRRSPSPPRTFRTSAFCSSTTPRGRCISGCSATRGT